MNSRAKGARGEREWRDFLRSLGLEARRGQQYSGSPDSPDVVCPGLPSVHWEVKRVEAGSPYTWMAQAQADAGLLIPAVAHKRNGREWLVVLPAVVAVRALQAMQEKEALALVRGAVEDKR